MNMWIGRASVFCVLGFVAVTNGDVSHHDDFSSDSASSSHWTAPEADSCSSPGESCPIQSSDVANQIINGLYSTIRKAEENLANPSHYPPNYKPSDEEEFDFVVVGAGSAGAVVANRLTEESSWRVLLIEAGGNPPKSADLPGLSMTMQLTDVDWKYKTDPEEDNCLGMVNKSCTWPRGKVLGGSSVLNYMEYVRGNAKDYDNWAAAGNTGWGYEDVLHYFKKSEDMRVPEVLAMKDSEKYHGRGGYLKLERWTSSETDSLLELCGKGLEELGYPFNTDYNGKTHKGFTRLYATLEDHKRCSTAKAFLSPIKDRNNLKVAKESLVTKVLINKDTSTAFGVELVNKDGKTIRVLTRKEVVLSAGAINTPQILLLSGIGPKSHLDSLGVSVVKDLPVGENLQDHPFMNSVVITVNSSVPVLQPERSMLEFLTEGSGGLTNLRALSYAAFVNTEKNEVDLPDIEFIPIHLSKNDPGIDSVLSWFNYREDVIRDFKRINEQGDSLLFVGSLLRPYSRGRILLKSTDPTVNPKIVSGSLSDKRDVETFLRLYNLMERWVQTDALRSVDGKLHEIRLSGCEQHSISSREYRECSLRHLSTTTYHYCCSCKMGPTSDPAAVVDPALRVYGVKGLRVADASVMPCEISGNINAAVIMVGEKAADLIKESWS